MAESNGQSDLFKARLVPRLETRGSLDGRTAPGECRLSQRADGQLVIERADPKVWLEDTFLQRLIGSGHRNQWVQLTWPERDSESCEPMRCCQRFRGGHCYYGATITIIAVNRSARYKIGAFLRGGYWEAQLDPSR